MWGAALYDNDLAEAIVDRFLERGDMIRPQGKSYRNPRNDDQERAGGSAPASSVPSPTRQASRNSHEPYIDSSNAFTRP